MDKDSAKSKRRIRYKGNHPRRFEEKYKELNSDKYASDVEKVVKSGKTPAGTHRPVCVNEILDILKLLPGEIGLDATLGFGGHALELLKKIIPKGRLFALDVDPIELERTQRRLRAMGFDEKELGIKRSKFIGMSKLVPLTKGGFDFVLADLGVSSMQLDNPARGFTFKHKGPLDLRFNPKRGQPAATLIKSLDEKQLKLLFIKNSDEPFAQWIARAVFRNRDKINTTTDLAKVVRSALSDKAYGSALTDSIRRTFQALRIEVNQEFSVLEKFLRNLPFCLKAGARVAILTFHSGEDSRVMNFFKQGFSCGVYERIGLNPIRPSAKEQYSNPRSKSAILRWAIKK